jgi:glucose-1-phosphate cytidylyltransferase
MKAVILAGGRGSRIEEESSLRPKPLVEIGSQPILWHIMKIYAAHGIRDFVICAGYKSYMIKEYFANLGLHHGDITFDLRRKEIDHHGLGPPDWRVTVAETGLETETGGRLGRIRSYLGNAEPFCLTYGDGVADVDIRSLIAFHRRQGGRATMTTVVPPARFGAVELEGDRVLSFAEKPLGRDARINGGFFVVEPDVLDMIQGDSTGWEVDVLMALARAGELRAYRHDGFWHPMDTLREKMILEGLWAGGKAPWKIWD